jgi:hypothetical protein
LKFHKTAKAFFGNPWRKTTQIWKSLQQSFGGRHHSAASARRSSADLNRASPNLFPDRV